LRRLCTVERPSPLPAEPAVATVGTVLQRHRARPRCKGGVPHAGRRDQPSYPCLGSDGWAVIDC
jgi:hypothetical protein